MPSNDSLARSSGWPSLRESAIALGRLPVIGAARAGRNLVARMVVCTRGGGWSTKWNPMASFTRVEPAEGQAGRCAGPTTPIGAEKGKPW